MDLNRMLLLAEKTDEVDNMLEKLDQMDLIDGDMAYYISVYTKILKLIEQIYQ